MTKFTRRRLMAAGAAGAALGVGGAYSNPFGDASAQEVSSPLGDEDKWVQQLPIPDVRDPDGTRDGVDYYDIKMREFEQQLHPELDPTTLWGFDGSYPGPTIAASSGEPIKVRFDNLTLPDSHLLTVDESVGGTQSDDYPMYDGPVPEVRNSVHFHGANIPPEDDGQSMSWKSPGGVTGPGYVKDVQDVPNNQSRATMFYHPHSLGITRLNVYAGLVGFYQITDDEEESLALPSGDYDVPLLIQDRTFDSDGSLYYPDSWISEFSGDTAVVNGAVWPYMEVEPRRYRFRIANGSNARAYNLLLRNEGEAAFDVPPMHQIAPGHEFLEDVVTIGTEGGEVGSLTLTSFERAEVVIDFSEYAGETLTLTNNAEFPYKGNNEGSDLSEIVQFRVQDTSVDDPSADPNDLELPAPTSYDPGSAQRTRHHTLDMETRDGLRHTLNGYGMLDEGGTVRPHLGATEVWEFENTTSQTHPIHMHLVKFRVLERDIPGEGDGTITVPPDPNELGPKDVVRVEPGETVRVVTEFGDYTGKYPWHCHMLEHEDNSMMLMFDVVREELLDYADETGVITQDGLDAATADWENGDIGREVMADVVEKWRNGEPVVDDEAAGIGGAPQ